MKKLIYFLLILPAVVACKKEKQGSPQDNGTIIVDESPVTNSGNTAKFPLFNSQDSVIVYGLMSSNNLSTNGFVFYMYQSFTAFGNDPNQLVFFQNAIAKQVRNGLPVFYEDITFNFGDGKYDGQVIPPQFIVGNITLDNKPNLSLQTLRSQFVKTDVVDENQYIYIRDSTLVAQLGYYNLNVNNLAVGGAPNYIKAWYVHPQHSKWPQGYFRDDSGAVISFEALTRTGPPTP